MNGNASEWIERQKLIETAFLDRALLQQDNVRKATIAVLRALELGSLRVVTPPGQRAWSDGEGTQNLAFPMTGDLRTWEVHGWVKQAVLLAFAWRTSQPLGLGEGLGADDSSRAERMAQGRVHGATVTFMDKFDVRSDLGASGVRVVPPGAVREGSFVAKGCIVMPGFVNVGAWVGAGTMVDTWATVGSCAQIGQGVHLAGGVGIGGVLEPPGARPVMIGDHAFIGSRCIVVEGAVVSSRAVLGAGVCLTATTPVYDVTTAERPEYRGYVPPNAIVAPGTREREFPGGRVPLSCGYIIGYRSEKTDERVALNDTLREYGVSL
jgi:2,3,4,5-tetrahydropyridine-2-carboxylate N-succinyltransferase